MAQRVAADSVKLDGCPALFSEGTLPVGRLCVRKTTSQQFIVESSDNERHFLHADISCTQTTRRGGTMLRRPIQVVLSGFRRVLCVNSTVGKLRHCNDNYVNLNNMSHTQTRHTRALGSNMQHDVHVSRNGANHNNLINVQSNKWDLPTIINTNIRGA